LFGYAYKRYSYAYGQEKAHTALGQADSLRLLGKYDLAAMKYEEVEEYAKIKGHKRLLARVLRNKAEMTRLHERYGEINAILDELTHLSVESDYLFGRIYMPLIKGGICLKSDPGQAIDVFSQICGLVTDFSKSYLRIEYAHYLFGTAEAMRLCEDDRAEDYYTKAHKLYKETGVLWGIVRTGLGLGLIGGRTDGFTRTLRGLHITDPLDKDFIRRASEGKLDKSEVLFLISRRQTDGDNNFARV
jgi:tetratricopeptide (TPR) repeat protein